MIGAVVILTALILGIAIITFSMMSYYSDKISQLEEAIRKLDK